MTEAVAEDAKRSFVLESLVGETADPVRLNLAANALGERVEGPIMKDVNARLSHPLEVKLGKVTLTRHRQVIPGEPGNKVVCVAAADSSPDALTMILDGDAVAILVSAAFGGDTTLPSAPIEREFTPIERSVASMMLEAVARAFDGSGERALKIGFPLPAPVCGEDVQKLSVRDGPAVELSFRLRIGSATGRLSVVMPQRVLVSNRGQGGAAAQTPAGERQWRTRFSKEVMRSGVKLEATVPLARMTLGELAGLKVGQTIALPEAAPGDTRLSARRKTVFICEFGRLGNHFTVRIKHPFDAGREFMDGLVAGSS